MSSSWSLAVRNLLRNKRRSLMTASAVAFGYAGLVLLTGYAVRVERYLRTNAIYLQRVGHVAIYKEGGLEKASVKPRAFSLGRAEQDRIAAFLAGRPEVELVGRYLKGVGLVGNGCKTVPFLGLGVEPDVERRLLEHPMVRRATPEHVASVRGQPFWSYGARADAVALSTGLARLLGKNKVHDELRGAPPAPPVPDCASPDVAKQLAADANVQMASMTYEGGFSAADGEVVSIFRTPLAETENSSLLTSLPALQKLYETDAVTYMSAYVKEGGRETPQALARAYQAQLRAAGLAVSAYPFDEERLNPYYVGSLLMIGSIVTFITILVLAVVSLATLNVMTLSVLERTREIGMFRALGFTRSEMLGLFVRETVALCVAAMLVGAAVGATVAAAVNHANIRFNPPGISGSIQLLITPSLFWCAALSAVILPLAVLATISAVRSRTRERVVRLLTEAVA